jgi:hypothetical protein
MEDKTNRDNMKMIKAMDSLINELDYFVYLIEKGEIKGSTLREYYRKRLVNIFSTAIFINKAYPDSKGYSEIQKILHLIQKYHKITGKVIR